MKHILEPKDGILEIKIVGKILSHEVDAITKEIKNLLKDKQINLLTNFTHAGKHDRHSQNLISSLFQEQSFNKVAACNLDTIPARIITGAVKRDGLQNKVRLFRTRDEAEQWLSD